MRILNSIILGSILATGFNCDSNPPLKPLEIIYPKGEESFQVGQTVKVQWRINDLSLISSVAVWLSPDNGKSFIPLADHSFGPESTAISWTVQTDQVSDQCFIKVNDYIDESLNDKSGLFSVTN